MAQEQPPTNEIQAGQAVSASSDTFQDLLFALPEGTLNYQFTSLQDFGKKVLSCVKNLRQQDGGNPFLVFSGVPDKGFERITDESFPVHEKLSYRVCYNRLAGILLLETVVFPAHERAVELFKGLITLKVNQMGLSDALMPEGSADLTFGHLTKQSDGCWVLNDQPGGPKHQLALEVGLSESLSKLNIDARALLEPRNSDIEIVITIKIYRENARIVIRKWEIDPQLPQSHVTRSSPRPVSLVNEVVISRTGNATTTSGTLQLTFEKVFSRPRNPNSQEQDISFTVQDLQTLGEAVWVRQGFIW